MRTIFPFLARTVAVTAVVFLALPASPAQSPGRPPADEQNRTKAAEALNKRRVPRRYLPFQGQWRVVSQEDAKGKTSDCPEILVAVRGMKFELSGPGVGKDLPMPFEFRIPATKKENPYRALQEGGMKNLDDIVDVENQIEVFWFVGIYKLSDDELHLALKYCGQGVEGAAARNFRPPSSFQKKPMDGEIRITLKRQVSLDDLPDLEAATYRVDPYIRAAAALQEMGKDKAGETLSKLARGRKHDNQVIVLCRMLFTCKAKGEFRRPGIGAAHFLGGTDYSDWLLEPIELVDGVPFLITRGYDLAGYAEPAESYVKYCLRNGDWSSTRFKRKDDQEKQKALKKLLASPKWKARLEDTETAFLSSQIK